MNRGRDANELHCFVALVELMDSFGCRFHVTSRDQLDYVGPTLPAWCDDVIVAWFDVIVAAWIAAADRFRLYACTTCLFAMLLTDARKGRRCPACGAERAMTHPLPIHFVNPPARRRITRAVA